MRVDISDVFATATGQSERRVWTSVFPRQFDLVDKGLHRHRLLIIRLERYPLMIERLLVILSVNLPPYLIPFTLSLLPLLFLVL